MKNIMLEIIKLLHQEFKIENVIGSDTTYNGKNAFLLQAEKENTKIEIIINLGDKK